ncbi:unnamed protein product [Prorocentrum cordatum]|uniref:subtilisin n=1 Tax=Prorocentrum cordatum TaxID=2364126 RepID=A0ABN9QJJ1_9DINO|nr:unnamed protein product [Polarella glacialis]
MSDDVTVVVAAGNENGYACEFNPAYISSAITVASYGGIGGSSPAMSTYSNYGSCVDVWAPGSSIHSTAHSSDTAVDTGFSTAYSCAHVTGLVAIMYEANPTAGGMTASQRWNLSTASRRLHYVTGLPSAPYTPNVVPLAPTPGQPPVCVDTDDGAPQIVFPATIGLIFTALP